MLSALQEYTFLQNFLKTSVTPSFLSCLSFSLLKTTVLNRYCVMITAASSCGDQALRSCPRVQEYTAPPFGEHKRLRHAPSS